MKKILMVLVVFALVCGSLFAEVLGNGSQLGDTATHNLQAILDNNVFAFGFLDQLYDKNNLSNTSFSSSVTATIIRQNTGENLVDDGEASTYFGWVLHSDSDIAFKFSGTPLTNSGVPGYSIGYEGVITGIADEDFGLVNDQPVKSVVVDAEHATKEPRISAHAAHAGLQKGILTITFTPVYYQSTTVGQDTVWVETDIAHMPSKTYTGTITVTAIINE